MIWEKVWEEHGEYMKKPDECIIESFDLFKPGDKILDLGCGTGRHTLLMLERSFIVTAMDCSKECLEILKKKVKASDNIKIKKNEPREIPAPRSRFDGVICNNSIHHNYISDIKKTMWEIRRVLKKNGILILTALSTEEEQVKKGLQIEPNTYIDIPDWPDGECVHHLFSEEELRDLLRGFEIITLEPLVEEINGYEKLVKRWKFIGRKR